jgi:hypothetical protein
MSEGFEVVFGFLPSADGFSKLESGLKSDTRVRAKRVYVPGYLPWLSVRSRPEGNNHAKCINRISTGSSGVLSKKTVEIP